MSEGKSQFQKRIESFLWRTGMMVLAMAIDFALQNIAEFRLPPLATVTLGLVLGELSKALNAKLQGA
jgi:hypothetical protein